MPRVRASKMRLPVRRRWYSSTRPGSSRQNPCIRSRNPSGRSCVTPPMRNAALGQARADPGVEEVHDDLALVQAVEEDAGGGEVVSEGGDEHEVAGQPVQARARSRVNTGPVPAPAGRAVSPRPGGRRGCWTSGEIIQAIGVGDELRVGTGLPDLLDSPVQIANDGATADHHLAFDGQLQPQHAVRAGMLRPHVQGDLLGCECAVGHALAISYGSYKLWKLLAGYIQQLITYGGRPAVYGRLRASTASSFNR